MAINLCSSTIKLGQARAPHDRTPIKHGRIEKVEFGHGVQKERRDDTLPQIFNVLGPRVQKVVVVPVSILFDQRGEERVGLPFLEGASFGIGLYANSFVLNHVFLVQDELTFEVSV